MYPRWCRLSRGCGDVCEVQFCIELISIFCLHDCKSSGGLVKMCDRLANVLRLFTIKLTIKQTRYCNIVASGERSALKIAGISIHKMIFNYIYIYILIYMNISTIYIYIYIHL